MAGLALAAALLAGEAEAQKKTLVIGMGSADAGKLDPHIASFTTRRRFPIADVYLTQFYDSASIVDAPRAVTNFSHCNVADDEIRARVETDPAKQKELWKTAQEKIIKAVCGVPVYEQLQLWAWKDNLDLGYDLKGSLNLAPPVTEKTHFVN